jgi:YD repeat-containing protein
LQHNKLKVATTLHIYSYNQAGQVTQLVNSRADNTVLSSFIYTYDASGRRDSMTTLAGTETYGYDPLGRPVRVRDPKGGVTRYTYDRLGRLRRRTSAISMGLGGIFYNK